MQMTPRRAAYIFESVPGCLGYFVDDYGFVRGEYSFHPSSCGPDALCGVGSQTFDVLGLEGVQGCSFDDFERSMSGGPMQSWPISRLWDEHHKRSTPVDRTDSA